MKNLESFFAQFRKNIIGYDQIFVSPYGEKKIIYADWIASGRLYQPIEKKIAEELGPFIGNTHTEASITGTSMTRAYHLAHEIIKKHVNAGLDDVIITAGFGMTAVINKFQRILGLKLPEQLKHYINLTDAYKPIVFLTHMEHHSNQTSWLETIADVAVIEPDENGLINFDYLYELLDKYKDRQLKIGSFTACSNVTGIQTPVHKLAKIMHENNGFCFIDYAASAPYVDINMHPRDPLEKLDAIMFSPHKFLGGPGASGVLIFDSNLYKRKVPDQPGGGTVDWTNPWGHHKFVSNIEAREDGGTPGFLQAIKTALCLQLKNEMGTENIKKREGELVKKTFEALKEIPYLQILANNIEERLGVFSFYAPMIHFNLFVKILNDRYGIQVRGGCSCAGTYGHYLLHIDPAESKRITDQIDSGDLSEKPGWVRLSLHPTMTDDELDYILTAIKEIVENIDEWQNDYYYDCCTNEFIHANTSTKAMQYMNDWFKIKNL
ncbi:aminotransferase class V-fold PLP-dependent enzyme [candidate division KSB1 bacterium]|nr:aminotransferase class V-fold PLP-dependent enzyme [candidate division KSB1 bacterium]MBL7092803.1 aminotransferase class V-fold PLP-dependent enzyme [candidate division KSB1 bacterium]